MIRSTCVLLASVLLGFATTPAAATTYTVRPDGTGDFATIQQAIDAAVTGDIVLLASGTFSGPGNRDLAFHGKSITVRSAASDPLQCAIACESLDLDRHRAVLFVEGEGPGAVIEGVRIFGGRTPVGDPWNFGGAIVVVDASPTIRNCIVENCAAMYGGALGFLGSSSSVEDLVLKFNYGSAAAIYATGDSRLRLSHVTVYACPDAGAQGTSIALINSNAELTNCSFTHSGGTMLNLYAGASATVRRCLVAMNTGAALSCANSSATFECCDLFGNWGGDWVSCAAGQEFTDGNFSADPLICEGHIYDDELNAQSPCLPSQTACGELVGAWPIGCTTAGTGACCESSTGECVVVSAVDCGAGREYLGDGTVCDPSPCPTSAVDDPASGPRTDLELRVATPTDAVLRCGLRMSRADEVHLVLIDASGSVVARIRDGQLAVGVHDIDWNVGALPSGAYWLLATTATSRVAERVVILR